MEHDRFRNFKHYGSINHHYTFGCTHDKATNLIPCMGTHCGGFTDSDGKFSVGMDGDTTQAALCDKCLPRVSNAITQYKKEPCKGCLGLVDAESIVALTLMYPEKEDLADVLRCAYCIYALNDTMNPPFCFNCQTINSECKDCCQITACCRYVCNKKDKPWETKKLCPDCYRGHYYECTHCLDYYQKDFKKKGKVFKKTLLTNFKKEVIGKEQRYRTVDVCVKCRDDVLTTIYLSAAEVVCEDVAKELLRITKEIYGVPYMVPRQIYKPWLGISYDD
jgi:hypothetical protein